MPIYMNEVLEQMGWNDGSFLPVSNDANKQLETMLDARLKDIERLRAENINQDVKQTELDHHKSNVLSEHEGNMQLLLAHRQQMENEEHISALAASEAGKFIQDTNNANKQCKELGQRGEVLQADIARVLRRLETLRSNLGGERGAMEEWRCALERSEADIDTINRYSQEDSAKITELESKRQRLKVEYDKKHEVLSQLCADLQAEERSAERICNQIAEALAQRRRTVATWAGAVENLRQRDKDIRHIKEELEMLREFTKKRVESTTEKEEFLTAQINNNKEEEQQLEECKQELASKRQILQAFKEDNCSMENNLISLKRELITVTNMLSNMHLENKKIIKEKNKKVDSIETLRGQIEKYTEKLNEVLDGYKTAAQRIRQLEEMLNTEQKYLKQLLSELEHVQHCLFRTQQGLLNLKEEESTLVAESRSFKMTMIQLEQKHTKIEKDLLLQQENLYNVSFEMDSGLTRLAKLEGLEDTDDDKILQKRAQQLAVVAEERINTVRMLTDQTSKLEGDTRLLVKNITDSQKQHQTLQEKLVGINALVEGSTRGVVHARQAGRDRRAEEGALNLRAGHAERSLRRLGHRGYNLERARLDLEAAVNERTAEMEERRKVFLAQRRVLQEERSALNIDLKGEQHKIETFKKRYEVFVDTLGKDENGDALSVSYFKIKNAQEKAELQQEGDDLDAVIRKTEKEIAALEATLQIVDATNVKFFRSLDPIKEDDPEMQELCMLRETFHRARELRAQAVSTARRSSDEMEALRQSLEDLNPKYEELHGLREDLMENLTAVMKELKEQDGKMTRANLARRKAALSAKRQLQDPEVWELHEKDMEARSLADANRNAGQQLSSIPSLLVEQSALQFGLRLNQVYGTPAAGGRVASTTSNASKSQQGGYSDRSGSMISTRTDLNTRSDTALREQLLAARAPRTPLSSSHEEDKSSCSSDGKSRTGLGSLPVSVVMLGLDSTPVRDQASTSNVRRRSNIDQRKKTSSANR